MIKVQESTLNVILTTMSQHHGRFLLILHLIQALSFQHFLKQHQIRMGCRINCAFQL
ncbi:hypothetical protein HanPSC8_Chr04g0184551 [Helianthus annuus]|nr:hypothetical protein HanPSC8_Chr04g0184551 [Helianthus annuus]